MKYNHIPDVMSEFDCMVLTNNKLTNTYDFIECDDGVVMCKRDTITSLDDIYGY